MKCRKNEEVFDLNIGDELIIAFWKCWVFFLMKIWFLMSMHDRQMRYAEL